MFSYINVSKRIALHEAGHAITALALGIPFKAVAVLGLNANMTVAVKFHDEIAGLITLYAGVEATDLVYGYREGGRKDNILIQEIVDRSPELLEGTSKDMLEKNLRAVSRQILQENKKALQKFGKALYKKRFMEYDECVEIVGKLNYATAFSYSDQRLKI